MTKPTDIPAWAMTAAKEIQSQIIDEGVRDFIARVITDHYMRSAAGPAAQGDSDNRYFTAPKVVDDEERGYFSVVLCDGIDGNVADVYGETPDEALRMAREIASALNGTHMTLDLVLAAAPAVGDVGAELIKLAESWERVEGGTAGDIGVVFKGCAIQLRHALAAVTALGKGG